MTSCDSFFSVVLLLILMCSCIVHGDIIPDGWMDVFFCAPLPDNSSPSNVTCVVTQIASEGLSTFTVTHLDEVTDIVGRGERWYAVASATLVNAKDESGPPQLQLNRGSIKSGFYRILLQNGEIAPADIFQSTHLPPVMQNIQGDLKSGFMYVMAAQELDGPYSFVRTIPGGPVDAVKVIADVVPSINNVSCCMHPPQGVTDLAYPDGSARPIIAQAWANKGNPDAPAQIVFLDVESGKPLFSWESPVSPVTLKFATDDPTILLIYSGLGSYKVFGMNVTSGETKMLADFAPMLPKEALKAKNLDAGGVFAAQVYTKPENQNRLRVVYANVYRIPSANSYAYTMAVMLSDGSTGLRNFERRDTGSSPECVFASTGYENNCAVVPEDQYAYMLFSPFVNTEG